MRELIETDAEWLEANGRGGFASGTVGGPRTRRYHGLLLIAGETGRHVLVSGFDAWVETPSGSVPISAQRYAPDVVHPDGTSQMTRFDWRPWPQWTFQLPDGRQLQQELFVPHQSETVALAWQISDRSSDAVLVMRPFLSGRDYHQLLRQHDGFGFASQQRGASVSWRPRADLPAVLAHSNGRYEDGPVWYRNFLYTAEQQRGFDCLEDLGSPGVFRWDLRQGTAVWMASAETDPQTTLSVSGRCPVDRHGALRTAEGERRSHFHSCAEQSADAYIVKLGDRRTIVAGYPWFTDWGRDTFIAIRGLCLATGRLADAQQILLSWSEHVSRGMLPNQFPDGGNPPQYNSVDASLWFVIAADEYLQAAEAASDRRAETQETRSRQPGRAEPLLPPIIEPAGVDTASPHYQRDVRQRLQQAIEAILVGYAEGTRYRIGADEDGLLAAGEPGLQLTWMDAKASDAVVTPRIGKPVEVQALWLNALAIGARYSDRWLTLYNRGIESFGRRFWNPQLGCLYDVVDADHQPGRVDDSIRPNQIFAVGGLPLQLIDGPRAASIVQTVYEKLWTPLGLRTLDPEHPDYKAVCCGGMVQRDEAYHQGTAWPWLTGPLAEAWIRIHGSDMQTITEARERFLQPLQEHLNHVGLGHVSEIVDGRPPHTPRGCPFQAWSMGELLRMQYVILREPATPGTPQSCGSSAGEDLWTPQRAGLEYS